MRVKSNKVLISLPDNYVFDLDSYSRELSLTRSDIIRRALDDYFQKIRGLK